MSMETIVDKLGRMPGDLESVITAFQSSAPSEFKELTMSKMREYASTEILDYALKVGDTLPDFLLMDGTHQKISSVDLRAKGPLVVTFFRGGWCPLCSASIRMISRYHSQFKAHGATVVAISPQTPTATKAMVDKLDISNSLVMLSDNNSEYTQACNIAYEMDHVLRPFFKNIVTDANGNDDWILPIPATYAVDTNGTIIYAFVETDYTKRAEPLAILNVLPPLQLDHLTTLRDALEYEGTVLRDQYPLMTKTMSSEIRALRDAGVAESALQVGDPAPFFLLRTREGKKYDSKKLLKQGRPLIVMFYHGHWSSLCTITLNAMQKYVTQFQAKGGATVVAISPDPSNNNNTNTKNIQFPLLVDEGSRVAKQFRIKYHMDTELPGKKEPWPLPMPATYIIEPNADGTGTIGYAFVDCDHGKRAEPSDILEALPAKPIQYDKTRGPFSLRLRGWLPAKKSKSNE